ncbi:hypothetical protein QOZ83_16565 [Romboutsia sedimentorum]|uniref:hypothetical protein n=1 Tax=Romboutsia sedimentorum TaxID=1368474 RepID=UPI0024DE77D1|nr:hypothetical protein [Romboutsia sedimentorum]MDK2587454.1 hypothetical protein [Romboutsia sedimentorum]
MSSSNEYYKEYRRAERDVKSGKRDDLIDDRIEVDFKSKKITHNHLKKLYKYRLETKEHEYIFNNCLDLISLIESSKIALEQEGAYIKNATGVIKVNPAQKELRENLKAFTNTLSVLHELLKPVEEEVEENRFSKFAKK